MRKVTGCVFQKTRVKYGCKSSLLITSQDFGFSRLVRLMIHREKWRKDIKNLSDAELDDELQRPTSDWNEDVLRETLRRLLKNAS